MSQSTTTDTEILNQARNSVLYGGAKNSIVEWTLSDEWISVEPFEGHKQPRGILRASGLILTLSACHGEILNAN